MFGEEFGALGGINLEILRVVSCLFFWVDWCFSAVSCRSSKIWNGRGREGENRCLQKEALD